MPVKLEEFGALQARYLSLPLAQRADAVLYDAEPALQAAEEILETLSGSRHVAAALAAIRASLPLIGKLRPSEAKNVLVDPANDFIACTRCKLVAWRRSMERLAQGEAIEADGGRERLPAHSPLGLALLGNGTVSSYLSIMQVALGEAVRLDGRNANQYARTTTQIRRCATILSDCETASEISKSIY